MAYDPNKLIPNENRLEPEPDRWASDLIKPSQPVQKTNVVQRSPLAHLQELSTDRWIPNATPQLDKAAGVAPSYWSDPRRIGRYYHAIKALPDESFIPEWIDAKGIEAAYNYLTETREGSWDNWDNVTDDDPLNIIIKDMPVPPPNFMPLWEQERLRKQYEYKNQYNPSDTTGYNPDPSVRDTEAIGISQETWEQLPEWKKAANRILPVIQTGMPGLGGAIIGGTIGGPLGALAGSGLMIGGAKFAEKNPDSAISKIFLALNWPAEQVEKLGGLEAQIIYSLVDPEKYGELSELFGSWENFVAAYKAGAVFYESIAAGQQIIDDRNVREEIKTFDGTLNEYMSTWIDSGGEVDQNRVIIGHDITSTEDVITEVPDQKLANAWIMQEARNRILKGESAKEVYFSLAQNFGFLGSMKELVGNVVLDPLDLIGPIGNVTLGKVGKATGNTAMVEAFGLKGENLIQNTQMYKRLIRQMPPEQAAQLSAFDRWLGNMTAEGLPKEYSNAPAKNPFNYLFGLTPKSRANYLLSTFVDGLNNLIAHETDIGKIDQMIDKISSMSPMDAVKGVDTPTMTLNIGGEDVTVNVPKWYLSGEAQMLPTAIKDASPVVKELLDAYRVAEPQRAIINRIAEYMGMDGEQLVKKLHNATSNEANHLYTQFVLRLQKAAQAGDTNATKILDTLTKADEFKALSGGKLKQMADEFTRKNGIPFNESILKYKLLDALEQQIGKWAVDWFGVKPDKLIFRMGNVVKRAQGALLLGFNPAYFFNNTIDNLIKMSWDGLIGLGKFADHKLVLDNLGFYPTRYSQAAGAMDVGGIQAGNLKMFGIDESKQIGGSIRAAGRVDDSLQTIDDLMKKGDKWQGAQVASQLMEKWSSQTAMVRGIQEYLNRAWQPGKGFDKVSDDLKLILDAKEPGLSKKVERMIAKNYSKKAIEKAIFGDMERYHSIRDVLDPDSADMLDHLGLIDEIDKGLKKAVTEDDIFNTFVNAIEKGQNKIAENIIRKMKKITADALMKTNIEGFQGVLDMLDNLEQMNADFWLKHMDAMGQIFDDASKRSGQFRAATWQTGRAEQSRNWNTQNNIYGAKVLGIFEGLGMDSASPEYLAVGKLIIDKNNVWNDFFRLTDDLYTKFQDGVADVTDAERMTKWNDLNGELNQAYLDAVLREDDVINQLNDTFIVQYAKQFENKGKLAILEARNWRSSILTERRKMMQAQLLWRNGEIPEEALKWGDLLPQETKDAIAKLNQGRPIHTFNRATRDKISPKFWNDIYRQFVKDMSTTSTKNAPGMVKTADLPEDLQADLPEIPKVEPDTKPKRPAAVEKHEAEVWKVISEKKPELGGVDENGLLIPDAKLNIIKYVLKWSPEARGKARANADGKLHFTDIMPADIETAIALEADWIKRQMALPLDDPMRVIDEQGNVIRQKPEPTQVEDPLKESIAATKRTAEEQAEFIRQENERLRQTGEEVSDYVIPEPLPGNEGFAIRVGTDNKETFEIINPDGGKVTGYINNQDFPGKKISPTRGELFYVEVPKDMQGQGIGTNLAIEAIRLMETNGAKTVNMDAVSPDGSNLVKRLIDKNIIEPDPINTSTTGKNEYVIISKEKLTTEPIIPEAERVAQHIAEQERIRAEELQQQESELSTKIAELDQQYANSNDTDVRAELRNEIAKLEKQRQDLINRRDDGLSVESDQGTQTTYPFMPESRKVADIQDEFIRSAVETSLRQMYDDVGLNVVVQPDNTRVVEAQGLGWYKDWYYRQKRIGSKEAKAWNASINSRTKSALNHLINGTDSTSEDILAYQYQLMNEAFGWTAENDIYTAWKNGDYENAVRLYDQIADTYDDAAILNLIHGDENMLTQLNDAWIKSLEDNQVFDVADDWTTPTGTIEPAPRMTPEQQALIDARRQYADVLETYNNLRGNAEEMQRRLPPVKVGKEAAERVLFDYLNDKGQPGQYEAVRTIWEGLANNYAKNNPGKSPEDWYETWVFNYGGDEFDISGLNQLYQEGNAPQWYLQSSKIITEKMPNKATPEVIKNLLKGVKKEELDTIGLNDWLDQQTGKISKEQVLDYIEKNNLQVEEVVRGSRGNVDREYWDIVNTPHDEITPEQVARMREIESMGQEQTKYGNYTLPGGDNYRELLLTLPVKRSEQAWYLADNNGQRFGQPVATREEAIALLDEVFPGREDLQVLPGEGVYDTSVPVETFKSQHWSEPNVVAHARFQDYTDVDGKRVLLIEEIQSDWHQKGRERGYQQPFDKSKLTVEYIAPEPGSDPDIYPGYYESFYDGKFITRHSGNFSKPGAIDDATSLVKMMIDVAVPEAPFKTTWPELVMKRMIRWAAKNGYDRVAWTPGKMQADRYNLAKQVDKLDWSYKEGEDTGTLTGYKDGSSIIRQEMKQNQLPDYIGKEAAKKILEKEPDWDGPNTYGYNLKTLSGEKELSVGGHGMQVFYDEMIPSKVKKYIKKWNSEVKEIRLSDKSKVQAFDITPQMRRAVLTEGQPLFQQKRGLTHWTDDGLAIMHVLDGGDISTIVHETIHIYTRQIGEQHGSTITDWLRKDHNLTLEDDWYLNPTGNREASELLARGFEKYLADGKAPTPKLVQVFENFKRWMVEIYKSITGSDIDIKLNDDVKKVFDEWVAGEKAVEAELNNFGKPKQGIVVPITKTLTPERIKHYEVIANKYGGYFDQQNKSFTFMDEDGAANFIKDFMGIADENAKVKTPDKVETTTTERPKDFKKPTEKGVNDWELSESDFIERYYKRKTSNYRRAIESAKKRLEGKLSKRSIDLEERNIAAWEMMINRIEQRKDLDNIRADYVKLVKKAISKGEPVPEAVIAQYPEFTKAVDARARYEKGWKTSFANRSVAINESMKPSRGIKVKRQDGSQILPDQVEYITKGLDEVESVLGSLFDVLDYTDLTIVHTNGKHPFLKTAGGTYHASEKSINVGVTNFWDKLLGKDDGIGIRALAHELAHWLDHEAGKTTGESIMTSRSGSVHETSALSALERNQLIRQAQQNINNSYIVGQLNKKSSRYTKDLPKEQLQTLKVQLGPYWNRPEEVFARLVEQYISNKLGKKSYAADSPDYYNTVMGWWNQEVFDTFIPQIEAEINKRLQLIRDFMPEEARNKQPVQPIDYDTPIEPSPEPIPTENVWNMASKPRQQGFFEAGEDTPLFSGTAQRAADETFTPQETAPQDTLFDTREQLPTIEGKDVSGQQGAEGTPLFGAEDIPDWARTSESYMQAMKQPDGKYKLFYRGTTNEPFPGEVFNSASEARNYWKARQAQWGESNQPSELFQDAVTPKDTAAQGAPFGTADQIIEAPTDEMIYEGWMNEIEPTLRKAMNDLMNSKVPEKGSIADGLSPEGKKLLRQYIGKTVSDLSSTNMGAVKYAEARRKFSLLDYSARTGFDSVAGIAFPYQFWYTRSALNWITRLMADPKILADYLRLTQFAQEAEDREGFPTRLKGKVGIPAPFLPDWMGDTIYIDPMRKIFNFEEMVRPFTQLAEENNLVNQKTIGAIQRMLEDQTITEEQAKEAIETRKGEIWEQAETEARAEAELEIRNPFDFAFALASPSLPLSIGYNFTKWGDKDRISQLPITRTIQGITSMMGIGGPRGVNIEEPFRKGFGLPLVDRFEDYRINRELSNMVADGLIDSNTAVMAMINRTGPEFEEAQSRVATQMNTKLFLSSVGLDFFPEGEQEMRAIQSEYYKAMEARYEQGDEEAFVKFWDEFPEYEARQAAVNDDPEEMLRHFLRSRIWQAWNEKNGYEKQQLISAFGDVFENSFMNKETRNYDDISTETYAAWAKTLGQTMPDKLAGTPEIPNANIPEEVNADLNRYLDDRDAEFPGIGETLQELYALPEAQQQAFRNQHPEIEDYTSWRNRYIVSNPSVIPYLTGESSELYGLPEHIQLAVYQYRVEVEDNFPDIWDTQSAYFNIANTNAKRSYLKQHPELTAYWDYRREYAAMYPQAAPYILSEQSLAKSILGEDRYSGTTTNVNQVQPVDRSQFDDALLRLLASYFYGGRSLTPGARAELNRLWEKAGKPLGSMDNWLNSVVWPEIKN